MMFNKKQQQKNDWLAVRMTDERIYLAQTHFDAQDKPVVDFIHIEQLDDNRGETVMSLAKKHQLKSKQCNLVLDATQYQLLQVQKPNVPQDEQRDAVRWAIKELLDYPVEEATVDFLEIPVDPASPNRQTSLYTVSVKNDFIQEMANLLIDSGVDLKAVDVQIAAQRNISSLLESQGRGVAMLSFNSAGVLLTFTAEAELYHARFIEIEGERTANAFERIALELQRSLDHFERQYPYVAAMKLLIAPFEGRDAFVEHLKTAIYQPIETFELMDVFEFSDEVALPDLSLQASLLPVLGASLRAESMQ